MKFCRRNCCRLICFSLIFFTLSGLFSLPSAAVDISVSAESAVLINAENGEIYFSKDSEKRLPMASTTKIMTALVALENAEISDTVSIDKRAVGVEGSSVYLTDGELLTLCDLLYAVLLASANDAAAAVAIEVGGSIEGFADMMNAKARELGLENTHFDNPHGLDSENHYTTALDLARITAEALKNETFAKIASTYKYSFDSENGTRVLINHNKLLRSYEGCIGVKTGFTKRSGRCLVSAAERDGLRLIAVTINAPDDWNDHRKMLDSGFSAYHKLCVVKEKEYSVSIPVTGGTDQTLLLSNTREISADLPSDITLAECELTALLPHFLYAPVEKGEVIGKLVCRANGSIIGESDITAEYSIPKIHTKKSFLQKLLDFVSGLFGR